MKCLYCDKEKDILTFKSLIEEDLLCVTCRSAMKMKKRIFYLDDLEIESFYEYDSLFKSILLQYKECYDEALKDVFLYGLIDYLRIKYRGYHILYVPSSKKKLEERGFNHLREIFKCLKLKEVSGLTMKEELVQEGKDLKEREKMKKNYLYAGEVHEKILIVDDVITTGSSIKGVYEAIRPFAGKVKILVLSYTFLFTTRQLASKI